MNFNPPKFVKREKPRGQAPQPPMPEDPAICRWCGSRRTELFPAEGELPALYHCSNGCAQNGSSPFLGHCPECGRDFKTGQRLASLCYECDQKERAAHQTNDDYQADKTYNFKRVGRGGYGRGW